MVNCDVCGEKVQSKNAYKVGKKVCDRCNHLLDGGADENTIKKMLSDKEVLLIWKENEGYSEMLAEAYYDSVIENYKVTDDSKENFGYNTFIDGIRMGLDIVIPMLSEDKVDEVYEKIESMLEFRNKENKKKVKKKKKNKKK